MSTFELPELDTDEDAVTDRILDGMTDRMPGWEPVEGAPEVALAEEIGREIAALNVATGDALQAAVASIGETLFEFPPYAGAAATLQATIMVTGAGDMIPAGFTVVGVTVDGAEVAFTLPADAVATGSSVTATLVCTEVGDHGNGVAPGALTVVTVTTVAGEAAAVTASTGGADPETLDEYTTRLHAYLGSLRPGGVNGADLAALARTVPGVHRARAVDLYDPADPDEPAERTATVFLVDEASGPVAAPVKAQAAAVLAAAREVNFVIHVEDPMYTPIEVEYAVVAELGASKPQVKTEIDLALTRWLSEWGTTPDDDQAWTSGGTVTILDAAAVIGRVAGVQHVTSVTLEGATLDVPLEAPVGLPAPFDGSTPSSVDGVVS